MKKLHRMEIKRRYAMTIHKSASAHPRTRRSHSIVGMNQAAHRRGTWNNRKQKPMLAHWRNRCQKRKLNIKFLVLRRKRWHGFGKIEMLQRIHITRAHTHKIHCKSVGEREAEREKSELRKIGWRSGIWSRKLKRLTMMLIYSFFPGSAQTQGRESEKM